MVETRQSPSGKPKWKPTSCGAFDLNDGAMAFHVVEGVPELDPFDTTDPLVLFAVADMDGGGVAADGSGDQDQDGLTDAEEIGLGTDPCNADTDGDGISDGDELDITIGHNELTDPLDADSDDDGINDGDEVAFGSDPNVLDADHDGDGQSTFDEQACGSDPLDDTSLSTDVDGDGVPACVDADDNDDQVQ